MNILEFIEYLMDECGMSEEEACDTAYHWTSE